MEIDGALLLLYKVYFEERRTYLMTLFDFSMNAKGLEDASLLLKKFHSRLLVRYISPIIIIIIITLIIHLKLILL
jgi:hypothetical protein